MQKFLLCLLCLLGTAYCLRGTGKMDTQAKKCTDISGEGGCFYSFLEYGFDCEWDDSKDICFPVCDALSDTECDDTEGCEWDADKEECFVEEYDGCQKQKKKNKCKKVDGCMWDGEKCIAGDKDDRDCSEQTSKKKCRKVKGCSWIKKKEKCQETADCSAGTDKKSCKKIDGCKWKKLLEQCQAK